jgi:PRTRC genetic system ThiF family protein
MDELNLDYLNARRLLVSNSGTVTLMLVGCGGTGSWLAPSVVRIARLLKEQFNKAVDVYFIDPDHVEEKNCFRQNFCNAEVGRNKADTLAWRYGLAWGVEIIAIAGKLETCRIDLMNRGLAVVIGCVDNAAARRTIAETVKMYRCWWLDCGNHQSSGQVLLGSGLERPENPFQLMGLCSWLPLPTDRHPELLDDAPAIKRTDENLSCAEMAMRDSQGMAINQRIAAEASDYLVRMLLTKDLCKHATYIDLASGSAKSKYILEDR